MSVVIAIVGSFGVVLVGLLAAWWVRGTSRVANRIAQKNLDLDVLVESANALRKDLESAQAETNDLRTELRKARQETRTMRIELAVAMANVGILSGHIRQYVPPSIPWPKMQEVHRNGED